MPEWPEKREVIGTSVRRLDGPQKVSGKAKYSYDRNLPGMLYGKIVRSPHPHARIVSVNLGPAEAMPGVKATELVKKPGSVVHYAGDEVAAVAAESEDVARDAARAVSVKYQVLPHIAGEEQAIEKGGEATGEPEISDEGMKNEDEVAQAFAAATTTVEGVYGCTVQTHTCLETHGLVAHWESDNELVVYASTQAVHATADGLRGAFPDVPDLKVACRTPFMGGGFGSKFGPDVQGVVAAKLARKARRPVKLMLERAEEQVSTGNRPSAYGKVKAGIDDQGRLVAFDAETWGTGGHSRGAGFPLPYVYQPAKRRRQHTDTFINAGDSRAMRAPGHPQGALIMEAVMDDLADAANIDPVNLRLANLPGGPLSVLKPIYTRQLMLGAERVGWFSRRHSRGDKTPGPVKRGLGLALGTWAGGAGTSRATCTLHADGRVEVRCGTQDLGTGTTTLVPMVAAEILGLDVKEITGYIGSSEYPPSGASGGSTTCGGVSLSVAVASRKALADLKEKVAEALNVPAANLEAEGGRIFDRTNPAEGLTWKDACALLRGEPITASADRREGRGMSGVHVGGAQYADVSVDIETGVVRVHRLVAVADCGLVMNRLLCESQVYGGVVGGINFALFEERRLDQATGLQVNPDMEFYKLARSSDLPDIEVHLLDYPERGVIGIGEPPTIPTAAAISNAVCNAIGVRVETLPITPPKVLAVLQKRETKER